MWFGWQRMGLVGRGWGLVFSGCWLVGGPWGWLEAEGGWLAVDGVWLAVDEGWLAVDGASSVWTGAVWRLMGLVLGGSQLVGCGWDWLVAD